MKRDKNMRKIKTPKIDATPTVNAEDGLKRRQEGDPMKLYGKICKGLRKIFQSEGAAVTDSQLDILDNVTEKILCAEPNTVSVIPLAPGGGKSTLIRAMLKVFAEEFTDIGSDIAKAVGGIVVVTQKSIEGHELVKLCNDAAHCEVATLVEGPNDSNLKHGGCINGTATCYAECLKKACEDFGNCPLVKAATRIADTPIVVVLHARYERYAEDMQPFAAWFDQDGNEYPRTLLLIDEAPQMFEEISLSIAALTEAENELDRARPSYQDFYKRWKRRVSYALMKAMRTPFFNLKFDGHYGVLPVENGVLQGFCRDSLEELKQTVYGYADYTKAEELADALLARKPAYYAVGASDSLFFPKLRQLDEENGFATFIFDGTAVLAPELKRISNVRFLEDMDNQTYEQLHIHVQEGSGFSGTHRMLKTQSGKEIAVAWATDILEEIKENWPGEKVLLATYKDVAKDLWIQLDDYHDILIPYETDTDKAEEMLPYFGGVHGSNDFRKATIVICLGLPRYEPQDYLARALALDTTGQTSASIREILDVDHNARLDEIPEIATVQNLGLANDIVQLTFRSALRQHGEMKAIQLYLLQPPFGLLKELKSYFVGCKVEQIKEFPERTRQAIVLSRKYRGAPTHAKKLLEFLKTSVAEELTPEDIRVGTGLSPTQYKEGCKNKEVKKFLKSNYTKTGNGPSTRYHRKSLGEAA